MAKEFLEFVEIPTSFKTKRFCVKSKTRGIYLGRVAFYPPWRQYIFEPDISTLWSDGCLKQVSEFLTGINAEWRGSRANPNWTKVDKKFGKVIQIPRD